MCKILFILTISKQVKVIGTKFWLYMLYMGAKGDWDFRISDMVKTLKELIFNPCVEFRRSPEGPVSQIHSPHLHAGTPGSF